MSTREAKDTIVMIKPKIENELRMSGQKNVRKTPKGQTAYEIIFFFYTKQKKTKHRKLKRLATRTPLKPASHIAHVNTNLVIRVVWCVTFLNEDEMW